MNRAWQGQRFKSKEYKTFENDVARMLPFSKIVYDKSEVFVHYVYHIKNYGGADTSNLEKTLTDMLVKRGYLLDDRYIRAIYQRKERAEAEEWVEITIEPYTGQNI